MARTDPDGRPEDGPERQALMRRSCAVAAAAAMVFGLISATPSAFAGRTQGLRFHAQSQSWTSPDDGWLMGSVPCAQGSCTTVVRTTDGGMTWKTLGTLGAPLTLEDATGVTEVVFADNLHGWAFGPALWATNDGGATWQQQASPAGSGLPVMALAGDATAAYVAVSACPFGQGLTNCKSRATLWRTTPGAGTWTQVSVKLPVAIEATLAVHGTVAYLGIPGIATATSTDAFVATVDGQGWSTRPTPCSAADGEYLSGIAPWSDTNVALLCQSDIGFGKAEKRVVRSSDTALTTSSAGTLPLYGIISHLAAAPDGTLVVSSYSIGSWIYRNAGGETWTTSEDLGDGGLGWNDVTFTTDQTAFVIHGPAFCCGDNGTGELWKSGDGGTTWRQTQVSPQP
jgi:photosystem II stability/assembly factor-like uncharacterized protein